MLLPAVETAAARKSCGAGVDRSIAVTVFTPLVYTTSDVAAVSLTHPSFAEPCEWRYQDADPLCERVATPACRADTMVLQGQESTEPAVEP